MSTVAATAVSQSSAPEGSRTITVPAVLNGDFVIIGAAFNADGTWTTPTGYTVLAGPHDRGTSEDGIVFGKAITADAAATTVTLDPAGSSRLISAACMVIRDSAAVVDVAAPTGNDNTDSTPICPSLTTVTDGSLQIVMACQRMPGGVTANTWTDPSGFGSKVATCSTSATQNNTAVAMYAKTQTTHGATGTTSIASAHSGAWVAFTLAVRPQASPTIIQSTQAEDLGLHAQVSVELFDVALGEGPGELFGPGSLDSHQTFTVTRAHTENTGLTSHVTVELIEKTPLTVELKLGNDWTDVTNYVPITNGITIRRGKPPGLSPVDPGQITQIIFDNFDGRFTPGAAKLDDGTTDNPYYPWIRINTPIRVARHQAGTSRHRFTGYVDAWPLTWEGGLLGKVETTATDALQLYGRHTLRDGWVEQALLDGVSSLYPLSDPDGSAAITDTLGDGPVGDLYLAMVPGTVSYAQPGPFASGATVMGFNPTGPPGPSGVVARFARSLISTAPFTLEIWFRSAHVGHIDGPIFMQQTTRTVNAAGQISYVGVAIREGTVPGTISFEATNQGRSAERSAAQSSEDLADGRWHHVACGVKFDRRTPFLYIDGQPQPVTSLSSLPLTQLDKWTRRTELAGNTITQKFFDGQLAGFGVYPGVVLDSQQVADHYNAGLKGFAGERTDQRIARLLSWAGITTADLDTGYSTCGVQETAGKSLLDAIREVERTEQGQFFIAGDGTPTFRSRYPARPSPVALVGADVDPSFRQGDDDSLLVNSRDDTGVGISPAHSEDLTSQDAYGLYSGGADTLLSSPRELQNFADYQIARFASPQPRTPSVTLDVLTEPSLALPAVTAELGDPVNLSALPAEAASVPTSQIDSIEETFAVDQQTVTYTLSPIEQANFAICNTSECDDGSVVAW